MESLCLPQNHQTPQVFVAQFPLFPLGGHSQREFLPDARTLAVGPEPDAFLLLIRHSQPIRGAGVDVVLQEVLEEQNWFKQPQIPKNSDGLWSISGRWVTQMRSAPGFGVNHEYLGGFGKEALSFLLRF